jgi:hypothetical protein
VLLLVLFSAPAFLSTMNSGRLSTTEYALVYQLPKQLYSTPYAGDSQVRLPQTPLGSITHASNRDTSTLMAYEWTFSGQSAGQLGRDLANYINAHSAQSGNGSGHISNIINRAALDYASASYARVYIYYERP